MRERTRLDQAIAKYRGFEQRLEDALTLIELGEAEEDEASVAEAEADLTRLRAVVAKRQLASLLSGRPTPTIAISRSMPGPAAPRRRTGPRC